MAAASASLVSELTNDGPVQNLINKRLRALRKKMNRITQMEEAVAQGKTLNKEQEETLRSKSAVLSGIDELEKLRQPLSQAVDQEIQLVLEKNPRNPDNPSSGIQNEEVREGKEAKAGDDGGSAVSDLLNLLYFSTIFDVKTLMAAHPNMMARTHERNCCISYDYVTDDDSAGDPLKEWDLDLISTLGGLLISRPVDSSSSHKNAMQKCIEHAKLWLANSDQAIDPNSNITYAYLREKLNKIMASDYYTTTPERKAPVDVAAARNYSSFQASVPVFPAVGVTVPVEGSHEEYQQQEELSPNSYDDEICEDEVSAVEEVHQGGPEAENAAQVESRTEMVSGDTKVDETRDMNLEEEHASTKLYQNSKGGSRGGRGRRSYSNGRGGRGGSRGVYQNGNNQFYDHPSGYYYPRNNYYRGRGGGRGFRGHYAQGAVNVGHAEAAS